VSRDPKLYLADIVEACRRVERFASGRDDDQIMSNEIVRDAILYNIVVIGEAATQLSRAGIEAQLPAIPWSRIRAMRNVLAHEYFGVDRDLRAGGCSAEDPRAAPDHRSRGGKT